MDVTQAVRETAMLADVTISVWGAEKSDPKIITKAKEDAGAVGNVGRAVKNLLAGADAEYKAVKAAYAAVRAQHYELTLPWVSDPHAERLRGPRLLPVALWDRYIEAMQAKKRVATQALDAFIHVYPQRIAEAQENLAGLADPNDYPDVDAVRGVFRLSFDFEPIPSTINFQGLPQATIEALEAQMHKRQQTMLDGAMRAMWAEVRDRMNRLCQITGTGEPRRLRESLVVSVTELTELMPGWNVAQDERADEIVSAIGAVVGDRTAAQIRETEGAMQEIAARAQGVLDKLGEWGL